ncbi:MAG TPA: HAD family hydrolase [Candidatus Enterenecus stercoripullorum]|nr:HAD family hydrolase [Candidatus Enterenecus stercoripullorum]
MGKFDGVLFFSDYDDTLYSTRRAVSPENRAAIRYFIQNGGRFSIATGRAHHTFTPQIEKEHLEFNAPVVLSNGAAIYDYQRETYLVRTFLCNETSSRIQQLCRAFPDLAFEAYHGEDLYVHNPNVVTMKHLERVNVPYTSCPIPQMPTPWNKVIMEQDEAYLQQVRDYILSRWPDDYEVIFSNRYLLELTKKGSDKGQMVARVAELLNISPEKIYCIGDNQNDLPMLALSAIPFAPANCASQVKEWGAHVLCHCDDHAVAQAIALLDTIY